MLKELSRGSFEEARDRLENICLRTKLEAARVERKKIEPVEEAYWLVYHSPEIEILRAALDEALAPAKRALEEVNTREMHIYWEKADAADKKLYKSVARLRKRYKLGDE